jgi:preprotein translocase subunit SecA
VEAKEGVPIKEENQTLATITLQNFFKLYNKICGMTGTAMTEANEFWKIYKLDVIAIPTNRIMQRINHPDVIYRTEREKFKAIADEVEQLHKWDVLRLAKDEVQMGKIVRETDDSLEFTDRETRQKETIPKGKIRSIERAGRPVLVGTVSIERSELISRMLEQRGVKHQVLNAKYHTREAEIISQAGRMNAVTIATNMAGRGTDIILGGNPEAMAWALLQSKYATRLDVPPAEWDALVHEIEEREKMKTEGREVAALGGLHVIGSERHESRRIDLQLRGRCGRQGDPGSSRFFLSLEDDLMRIFAGEWVKNVLTRLGMQDGEAIESRMVSRRIEGAQKKVEERHFESRKNLLEYDEVMDEQRKRVYGYRQRILDGANCKQLVFNMIGEQVGRHIDMFLAPAFGTDSFATWAGKQLSAEFEAKDFRGMDFADAQRHAIDQAERQAESRIFDTLEENLPDDAEDKAEWNWEATAKFVNTQWHTNLRDRDLKQVGRENLADFLREKAHEAIGKFDLSEGKSLLEPDCGIRSACVWIKNKFNFDISVEDVRGLSADEFKQLVNQKALEAYREREIEYPVMVGLAHFTERDNTGHKRYDRDGIAGWANKRFHVEIGIDDLKNRQREEVRDLLVELSCKYVSAAPDAQKAVADKLNGTFGTNAVDEKLLRDAASDGRLQSISDWLLGDYNYHLSPFTMARTKPDELVSHLVNAVQSSFRPEMYRLERSLLLQLLDSAWKEHLLVMDHLRNSVGLRGYAQIDPKVEYKREGMKAFEQMWESLGGRCTDLIFRMEDLNEEFVGTTWTGTETRHDASPTASDLAQQQAANNNGAPSSDKPQPIRNRQERVGRNDPCPCGSGKKYKNCHMKTA